MLVVGAYGHTPLLLGLFKTYFFMSKQALTLQRLISMMFLNLRRQEYCQ